MIHLDASALSSLFVSDRHTAATRSFLRAHQPAVGVGDHAPAECSSIVARRARMARVTAAQADRLLSVHDGWVAANAEPLDVEPVDVRVASTFVRRFEWACGPLTPCTQPSATGWSCRSSPSTSGKPRRPIGSA